MGCGSSTQEPTSSGYPRQNAVVDDAKTDFYNGNKRNQPPVIVSAEEVHQEEEEDDNQKSDSHDKGTRDEDAVKPEPGDSSQLLSQDADGEEPESEKRSELIPEPEVPTESEEDDCWQWRKRPIGQGQLALNVDDLRGYDFIAVDGKPNQFRMGRNTVIIDTRQQSDDYLRTRPEVNPGELWEDPDFGEEVAFAGLQEKVFYKRPKEICQCPALFTEGTTRFDIQQGRVGTCYFLSVIASLADKDDVLDQIFVSKEYDPQSESYDGVLHVRFWKFGKWVDVYIDDRIPVYSPDGDTVVWAAKSQDPNELWVTLLEKAYTKEFGGSYDAIYGGTSSDAFTNLTGGVTELFNHDEDLDDVSPSDFFSRVTNSLKCGSLVTCSSKGEKDGVNGIVGDHAYTVTGSGIVSLNGIPTELFRIRNPWGSGEWKGAWSDDSEEWQMVSDEVKEALNVQGKNDGEFWMNLLDYFDNFSVTYICNLTPDFDGDGKADGLDNVCSMMGEWRGESAAGSDERKFDNPKFEIVVPGEVDQEDTVQVVIQCLQNEIEGEYHPVRVDLFLVDAVLANGCVVYKEITNCLTYIGGRELCYRYNLKIGRYLILPTTLVAGKEGEFLIRTFSALPLQCKEVKDTPKHVVRRSDLQFACDGTTYSTPKIEYISGEWNEKNAGGQISNATFCNNPQYHLQLTGPQPIPLSILILQDPSNVLALGFKLWRIHGEPMPLDNRQIYSIYDSAVRTTEDQSVFLRSSEAEGTFLLEAGEYVLLVFTDKPGDCKQFVLCLATSEECQVEHQDYNQ